jgi:hypothetical protein
VSATKHARGYGNRGAALIGLAGNVDRRSNQNSEVRMMIALGIVSSTAATSAA